MPLPITQMSCSLPDEAITDQAKVADSRILDERGQPRAGPQHARNHASSGIRRQIRSRESRKQPPRITLGETLEPRTFFVAKLQQTCDLVQHRGRRTERAPATPMAQPMSARKRRAIPRRAVHRSNPQHRLTTDFTRKRREGPLNTVDPATRKKVELPSAQTGMNTGFFAKTADSLIRDELVPQRGL